MIRAIIFDYGNVIARFDHRIFFDGLTGYSLLTRDVIAARIRDDRRLIIDYETGKIGSDEFFDAVVRQLQLRITKEEFQRLFVQIFERIPSTIALIQSLKQNFKIGLLSNTNEWHFNAEIRTLEIFPLFDAVSLSFQVGAMKPSRKIYLDALAHLNVEPHECLYIDDIKEFIDAAKELGLVAVQYQSPEQLLSSLKEMGIVSPIS